MGRRESLKSSKESSSKDFMEDLLCELTPKQHLQPSPKISNNTAKNSRSDSYNINTSKELNHLSKRVQMTKSLTNSCLTAPIIGKAPKDDVDYAALFEGIEDWDYHYSDGASSSILKSPVKRPTPLSQQFLKAIITSVNSDSTWNSSSKRMEREIEVEIQSKFGPNLVKNVLLCDNWTEVPFKVGNPINLINLPGSSPINTENETLIFSKSEPGHLIVLFPSMLVSATVICDAPECLRRGALNHRLQGKQPFSSEAMVRGIIVHEVIQNMLMPEQNEDDEKLTSHSPSTSSGPWTMSRILKEARKTSARHMENLFLIGKSVEEGIAMVSDYLSELPAWSSRYFTESDKDGETCFNKEAILVDPRNRAESNFELPRIAITKVIDIEEEIWSPKFGLKGQIDATVQAAVVENPMLHKKFKFNQPMNAKHSLFPLEIKTGKKPRGIEHIAQTMLYTLLMSDRYDVEITAGLLFYTSSNELIRVRAVKEELRQLMIVRNRLVIFLSRGPDKISSSPDDVCASPDVEDLSVSVPRTVLPEPIDEESCCKRCFVVDGCMLYRKTVEGVESISSGSDTLDALYKQKMGHISSNQAEFFRHWEGLISLEERELGKLRKSIWELTAEERQKRGHAFTEMVINHNFKFSKKSVHLPDRTKVIQFTYCFVRAPKSSILEQVFSPSSSQSAPVELSLLIGQINEFDPIVISIDGEKLAIARGFVLELKAHHIVVSIDHRLESTTPKSHGTQSPNKWTSSTQSLVRYRIDKDELMAGMGRIRDNLVQLFVRPENLKLRELVVDLKKPELRSIGEISEKITCFESTSLNENQRDVIEKVMSAKDYALVLGMPGTGKTTTIAELIKALVGAGKTVFLTSYTHSAVDSTLSKLIASNINMLRLGNTDKVSPLLKPYTLGALGQPESVEELERRFMEPRLVGATSLSINHPVFLRRKFDYCIVDEASQITLPTCLGPLRCAEVFVLVGDHFQLPPLISNKQARIAGLETSLFKLLTESHPEAVVSLNIQYRMNEEIMSLSNALVYDGKLRCGNEKVAKLSLELPRDLDYESIHLQDTKPYCKNCWISDVINPERKVVFIDTDQLESSENVVEKLIKNELEAGLAFQLVEALLRCGVSPSEIAVIAPYKQQIKLLMSMFADSPDLEILTADRSQGRDKDCIIMTMVRSNEQGKVGYLIQDWRRINVCLTRARKKLVIFGSRKTLMNARMMYEFLEFVEQRGWILELERGAEKLHGCLRYHWNTHQPSSNSTDSLILRNTTNLINSPNSKRTLNSSPASSPSRPRKSAKLLPGIVSTLESRSLLRDLTINVLEE